MLTLCVSSWCLWVHLLVPSTSISARKKNWSPVMLILRYLPHASVVKFTTTGVSPASLSIENIVLSVLLERRSELWTERLRAGIRARNVITTLPTHHPRGMSNTTKGLVLSFHPYHLLTLTDSPSSSVGTASFLGLTCTKSTTDTALRTISKAWSVRLCTDVTCDGHSCTCWGKRNQLVHKLV